jgi:hypothetical protein
MLYEKPMQRIASAVYGILLFWISLPILLLVGITQAGGWVGRMAWWQAYSGRLQYHETQARACGTWQRWKKLKHWAAFALLGAPVWVPLVLLAMWLLEKGNR